CASVVVEREAPVAVCVAVICTPGTTAPVASVTVPATVPVPVVCACKLIQAVRTKTSTRPGYAFIRPPSTSHVYFARADPELQSCAFNLFCPLKRTISRAWKRRPISPYTPSHDSFAVSLRRDELRSPLAVESTNKG